MKKAKMVSTWKRCVEPGTNRIGIYMVYSVYIYNCIYIYM